MYRNHILFLLIVLLFSTGCVTPKIIRTHDEFSKVDIIEVTGNALGGISFNPRIIIKEGSSPEYHLNTIAHSGYKPIDIKVKVPSLFVLVGGKTFEYIQKSETPTQTILNSSSMYEQPAEYVIGRDLLDAIHNSNYEAKFKMVGNSSEIVTDLSRPTCKKVLKDFYVDHVQQLPK